MGVPKFFRWLSERYPLINQMLETSEVLPEIDNLYLDMNGIIHNCTHPQSDDVVAVRLTEQEMILSIFNYIDKLLHIIQPKKLFYLAIDGVAPRAKLNQQRQRRFRTAKEAKEALEKAIEKGEIKDSKDENEKPFDSNVITPGTPFMTRLSNHLKFFIKKKIEEDASWRNVQVIFSGQEEPGEGEHKIMKYIRTMKQGDPNYESNVSHCLYGLDADLIMLALTTHEPHFILLREEVLTKKKHDTTNRFHLLHIGLLREYLQLEFNSIEINGIKVDLERIIDDLVLMCFFIGNDFLPNLPNLDIGEGALNTLIQIYKELLPIWKDYLTNGATIHWSIVESLLHRISEFERGFFGIMDNSLSTSNEGPYIYNNNSSNDSLSKSNDNIYIDRSLGSSNETITNIRNNNNNSKFDRRKKYIEDMKSVGIDIEKEEEELEEEEEEHKEIWKDVYYKEKFGKTMLDEQYNQFINAITSKYCEGLSWVLNYYHNGCVSWSWYYPYHYAPLATDLYNLSNNNNIISFELGSPFKPYQQLMAVLPRQSAHCLPLVYQQLMLDNNSPIADFYPEVFDLDTTTKKNAWESIVLIPFIEQQRLVDAINSHINVNKLSIDELKRNEFGPSYLYKYIPNTITGNVSSTLPGVLTDVKNCHVKEEIFNYPTINNNNNNGFKLMKGVLMGVESPKGFPTMSTLKFNNKTKCVSVNLFGHPSRKESIVIQIEPQVEDHHIAMQTLKTKIGNIVYVNWPYLKEAMLIGVSDSRTRYYIDNNIIKDYTWTQQETIGWQREIEYNSHKIMTSKAIDIGDTDIVCHYKVLDELVTNIDGSTVKKYSMKEETSVSQMIVHNRLYKDSRFEERNALPIVDLYKIDENVIYIGKDASTKGTTILQYGSIGKVKSIDDNNNNNNNNNKTITFEIQITPNKIPTFGHKITEYYQDRYYTMSNVARRIQVTTRTLSKLTGTVMFEPGRHNVGLNIKFSGKNQQVFGYTRKMDNNNNNNNNNESQYKAQWEFSDAAVNLLQEYVSKFPRIIELLEEKPDAMNYYIDELDIDIPLHLLVPPSLLNNNNNIPKKSTKLIVGYDDEEEIKLNKSNNDNEDDIDDESDIDDLNNDLNALNLYDNNNNNVNAMDMKRKQNNYYIINIKNWIKEKGIQKLSKVPCGSQTINKEGIKKIEEESTKYDNYITDNITTRTITGVNPNLLLLPCKTIPSDYVTYNSLGDRIIVTSPEYSVPFGSRGTIVSIRGNLIDIILDKPQLGGNNLHRLCSDLRGITLPLSSFLNVSNSPFHKHNNNFNNNNNNYNESRQRQQQSGYNNNNNYSNRGFRKSDSNIPNIPTTSVNTNRAHSNNNNYNNSNNYNNERQSLSRSVGDSTANQRHQQQQLLYQQQQQQQQQNQLQQQQYQQQQYQLQQQQYQLQQQQYQHQQYHQQQNQQVKQQNQQQQQHKQHHNKNNKYSDNNNRSNTKDDYDPSEFWTSLQQQHKQQQTKKQTHYSNNMSITTTTTTTNNNNNNGSNNNNSNKDTEEEITEMNRGFEPQIQVRSTNNLTWQQQQLVQQQYNRDVNNNNNNDNNNTNNNNNRNNSHRNNRNKQQFTKSTANWAPKRNNNNNSNNNE